MGGKGEGSLGERYCGCEIKVDFFYGKYFMIQWMKNISTCNYGRKIDIPGYCGHQDNWI